MIRFLRLLAAQLVDMVTLLSGPQHPFTGIERPAA